MMVVVVVVVVVVFVVFVVLVVVVGAFVEAIKTTVDKCVGGVGNREVRGEPGGGHMFYVLKVERSSWTSGGQI
jgi:hypothetical protein